MNTGINTWLTQVGHAMRRHAGVIRRLQWAVVLFYCVLLVIPAFLSLPPAEAGILNSLTLLAQFLFWGLWWPFVLLSVVLFGRLWCGVLCPEGSLSEWASRHGRGLGIPNWIRWGGWPTVGFCLTTLYGQLISVYDYAQAALLILGGSTLAAMLVGFLYGRGKRVWCRYLCPVSGVFGLLAKLAPVHFYVDEQRWRANAAPHLPPPNCAPLLDIRRMRGASACHACGRCSGQRDAVQLIARSSNEEIVRYGNSPDNLWEVRLLLYGVIGLAMGAFQWTVSPWFISLKQAMAEWLVALEMSKWALLFWVNMLLLVLGFFLPPVAIILMITPVILPPILAAGFDPIWFGIILTINMELGLITPPVGLNLFVINGIAPDIKFGEIFRGIVPFILIIAGYIAFLSAFPDVVLFLPEMLYDY